MLKVSAANTIQLLFMAVAMSLTVGCAKKSGFDSYDIDFLNKVERSNLTGGSNDAGLAYTGTSEQLEMEELKAEVPPTDENKAFAQSINWIEIQYKGTSGKPQLDMQEEMKAFVTFEQHTDVAVQYYGKIEFKDNQYQALLLDVTKKNPVKFLKVFCESSLCQNMKVLFFDNQSNVRGSARVKNQVRPIAIRRPVLQKDKGKSANSRDAETSYVNLTSMEVAAGKAYFKMSETEEKYLAGATLEGDIVETDGMCTPLESNTKGVEACLLGNSEDGGLVLKVSPKKNTFYWVELYAKKPNVSDDKMPCHYVKKSVHPLIKEVVDECNNPLVVGTAQIHWLADTGHSISKFFQLYEDAKDPKATGKAREFYDMQSVIKASGLHHLMSMVTLVESGFNGQLTSRAGAKGYWQITKATADTLKLSISPVDLRTQVIPSTKAATKYFKKLLEDFPEWEGSYKMALAGYNWGPYALQNKVTRVINGKQTPEQLELKDVSSFTQDFWYLFKKRMMPKETRRYVLKFLSAVLMGLDPEFYGLKTKPIDEYWQLPPPPPPPPKAVVSPKKPVAKPEVKPDAKPSVKKPIAPKPIEKVVT